MAFEPPNTPITIVKRQESKAILEELLAFRTNELSSLLLEDIIHAECGLGCKCEEMEIQVEF